MQLYITVMDYDLDESIKGGNKIYKGRNWKDSLEVTGDRYLDKYLSSSTIGFRCAMDRLGLSSSGLAKKKSNKKRLNNISYFGTGEVKD